MDVFCVRYQFDAGDDNLASCMCASGNGRNNDFSAHVFYDQARTIGEALSKVQCFTIISGQPNFRFNSKEACPTGQVY